MVPTFSINWKSLFLLKMSENFVYWRVNWLSVKQKPYHMFLKNKQICRDHLKTEWHSFLYIDHIEFKNGYVIFVENFLSIVLKQNFYLVISDEDLAECCHYNILCQKSWMNKTIWNHISFSIVMQPFENKRITMWKTPIVCP